MIAVSKKIEYSLEFISYLSKFEAKLIPLSQVSRDLKIPYRFLGQLAILLGAGGIVTAREGKNGGYRLTEKWKQKTLYEVMEVLEENKRLVKCLGGDCSRMGVCKMAKVWKRVEQSFVSELKKIKLEDL